MCEAWRFKTSVTRVAVVLPAAARTIWKGTGGGRHSLSGAPGIAFWSRCTQ